MSETNEQPEEAPVPWEELDELDRWVWDAPEEWVSDTPEEG